ncbi:hypothetical protein E2542_SST09063 [Spatholobus suberectus]|nr:hypothetical protein E2542_SST09063 [Spatholobus suberectus]
MPGFVRKKRVTDPFDDEARARLVGADHRQLSSGSQHSGDGDSLSLSHLIHGFLEEDTNRDEADSVTDDSDTVRVDSADSASDSPSVAAALSNNADPYKNLLLAHVSEAAENFAFLRERNASLFRRSVAAFLRERRHDAAPRVHRRGPIGGRHVAVLRGPRLPRAVRDRAPDAAVRGGPGLRSRRVRRGRGGAETHRFNGVRRGEKVFQEQGASGSAMEEKPVHAEEVVRAVSPNHSSKGRECERR